LITKKFVDSFSARSETSWTSTSLMYVFHGKVLKDIEGICWAKARLEGNMVEGYLVQEPMRLCHDIIGDLDVYVPQA